MNKIKMAISDFLEKSEELDNEIFIIIEGITFFIWSVIEIVLENIRYKMEEFSETLGIDFFDFMVIAIYIMAIIAGIIYSFSE